MRPVTLSEIPGDLRNTMDRHWSRYRRRDATVDGTLALLLDEDQEAVADLSARVKAHQNRMRVPGLVMALRINHCGISVREACRLVAIYTGLTRSWVETLYYRREGSRG